MQKDNMINMVDGAKKETQEVKKWESLSSGLYLQWSHPDLSHTLSYSQAIFSQPCEEERDHFLCWQHNFTDLRGFMQAVNLDHSVENTVENTLLPLSKYYNKRLAGRNLL